MADTKRRPGESTAEYRKRKATAERAERETARQSEGSASAGDQAKGLGEMEGEMGGMPKQKDYATTSEWAEALRKWREKKRAKKEKK